MKVGLINVPWARVDSPSIQCGLLKAVVTAAGFECEVEYCNIELARHIGTKLYALIASTYAGDLFGEWLFSFAAFGEIRTEEDYLKDYPEVATMWRDAGHSDPSSLRTFRRKTLPDWLDRYAAESRWAEFDVIGISSTCLQQTAALAVGRRLKEAHPETILLYGGASFDGAMGAEFVKKIPWIDFAVSGEGERTLPALLNALVAKDEANGDRDPMERLVVADGGAVLADLDSSPEPDYSDYFSKITQADMAGVVSLDEVRIPVEFSRGCWWGEKHQCTFCGLNGPSMAYRAKSSDRALREVESLLKIHEASRLDMVDNIMSMQYLGSFCTSLAEKGWDVSIFSEVKANLTKQQLSSLHRAGVNALQPGIENLSTHVLRLMNKGSSRLINLRLLKWARYYGMSVAWSILFGFPGERDEDYLEQARLVRKISHLEPPSGCRRFLLERFSPLHDNTPQAISDVQPSRSYSHVYPGWLDHSEIAYTFDYSIADCVSPPALAVLVEAVDQWISSWTEGVQPCFIHRRFPDRAVLLDNRFPPGRKVTLRGWRAHAYLACEETFRGTGRIQSAVGDAGFHVEHEELRSFLDTCCAEGLMECEDGLYLGLSTPERSE